MQHQHLSALLILEVISTLMAIHHARCLSNSLLIAPSWVKAPSSMKAPSYTPSIALHTKTPAPGISQIMYIQCPCHLLTYVSTFLSNSCGTHSPQWQACQAYRPPGPFTSREMPILLSTQSNTSCLCRAARSFDCARLGALTWATGLEWMRTCMLTQFNLSSINLRAQDSKYPSSNTDSNVSLAGPAAGCARG